MLTLAGWWLSFPDINLLSGCDSGTAEVMFDSIDITIYKT